MPRMAGLVAEASELLDEGADRDVLDAALIVAAQKVVPHEIAGHGSASIFARMLKHDDAARLLKQTIDEEERMDQQLTQYASQINVKAAA